MDMIDNGRLPKKENLVIGLDLMNDPCGDNPNKDEKKPLYSLMVYNKNDVDYTDVRCVYMEDGYDLVALFKDLRNNSRYKVALDNLEEALAKSKE